jgi:hypothetical protein
MTSTAHAARLHRISEGVVASYIHDISTSTAVGAPEAALSDSPATALSTLQSHRRRLPHSTSGRRRSALRTPVGR